MLLMLVVLALSVTALTIHYNISLKTLTETKLSLTESTFKRDCEKLANEMYMTSSIPNAITSTRYYEYIRGIRDGSLPYKYYTVLAYIRQALANQVNLRGDSDLTALYFRGCNSICTNMSVYPIAEDCFKKGIQFLETDSQVLMGTLKSKNALTLFPMQRVQLFGEAKEMMALLICPTDSPVSIMSLYSQESILEGLGYSVLPEDTYIQITSEDGQILMRYPSALSEQEKAERLTLTAPMDTMRANVTVWISKSEFAEQLAPARQLGFGLIALVAVVGLVLCFVLSRISVDPIRRLVSDHNEGKTKNQNEIVYLGNILNQSKGKVQDLQAALVSSLLAKVFSGAVLSESDEQVLRQNAMPEGKEYRAAVLSADPETNAELGPRLAERIEGLIFTLISPAATGVVFSGDDAKLTEAVAALNEPICCGISTSFADLNNLITAVRQARFALPTEPGTSVFQGGRMQSHVYSRLQHERLYQSVFSSDEADATAMLDSIAAQFTLSNAREVFYNVRFTLRSAAEEMELDTDIFDIEYAPGKRLSENVDALRTMLHEMFALIRKKSEGNITSRQEAVLAWLRENAYDSELCAASVAEHFEITEKKVYEIVRTAAGKSLNEYLLELRMRKAGKLLYSTQMGVGEVAVQCGYLAESTFYRVFKKFYGVTPIQYRQTGALPEGK